MSFPVLADALLTDEALISEINILLTRKSGQELAPEPRNTMIHAFIEEEIERIGHYVKTIKTPKPDITEELNQLLIQTVEEAWGKGGN